MLLRMLELKMQVDEILFSDCGLELPPVYDFVKKVEKSIGRKIKIVSPEKTFDDLFYKKYTKGLRKGQIKGFPFVTMKGCWVSGELKEAPANRERLKGDILYLGICYEERHRIQKGANKCIIKYPLIDWKWTSNKCMDYCKEKGLLSPVYKHWPRTGCWLCPKQNLKSLRALYDNYPDLWKKLKAYEKDSPHGFKPNFSLEKVEKKWKDWDKEKYIPSRKIC